MALLKSHMKMLLIKNGHLSLEGDETSEEMREALQNLRLTHTYAKCQRPSLGIAIELLVPDINVLALKSTKSRSAKTAALFVERRKEHDTTESL